MRNWTRRVRGAIGIGLTWGAAWFGAGIIFMLVAAPRPENPFFIAWGVLGFIAGVSFATILGMIEHRRRIDQLSLPRVAGWGALGGLSLATVVQLTGLAGHFLLMGPLFALAGAACAAGTLALARGGEERLLHAGTDPSAPAITSDPRPKLPPRDTEHPV